MRFESFNCSAYPQLVNSSFIFRKRLPYTLCVLVSKVFARASGILTLCSSVSDNITNDDSGVEESLPPVMMEKREDEVTVCVGTKGKEGADVLPAFEIAGKKYTCQTPHHKEKRRRRRSYPRLHARVLYAFAETKRGQLCSLD